MFSLVYSIIILVKEEELLGGNTYFLREELR